jgi:hypothetical protein
MDARPSIGTHEQFADHGSRIAHGCRASAVRPSDEEDCMPFTIPKLGWPIALATLTIAACSPSSATSADGGATPPVDGGGGGDDAQTEGGTDGGPSGAVRYTCPMSKPQKVYGYALNAKATLDSDETWTPDNVYLIFGPFHTGAHVLTIQAGTVVCFDYGPPGTEGNPEPPPGELNVEPQGALKVLGTPQSHVVFTQANDQKQYWGGFTIKPGFTSFSMANADVYNGGLSANGPVLATFWDPTQPPLDMREVVFYSVQRVGIRNFTSGFTPESHVTLNNFADETAESDLYNGYPVLSVNPVGANTVNAKTFSIGNVPKSTRYVQLDHPEGGAIDKDFRLQKLQDGLAWRTYQNMLLFGTTAAPMKLTIDPGTVVAISNGGPTKVGDGGTGMANIVAVGTATDPITFTSDAPMLGKTPAPGDWSSILIFPNDFDAATTKFDYVKFEFGGGGAPQTIYNCNDTKSDVQAEIEFSNGIGVDYDGPPITHSTFSQSAGQAIRARNNGVGTGTLKTNYLDAALGNTFTGFTSPPAQFPMTCP